MSIADWFARRLGRGSVAGTALDRAALVPLEAGQGPVYAVGDVHGCHALYRKMQAKIMQQTSPEMGRPTIILVGDLVDRGPEVAFLLDDLLAPQGAGPRRLALRGNHEQMMLSFLQAPKLNAAWIGFGGRETLASYGLYLEQEQIAQLSERRLQQMFAAHIPEAHIAYLQALPYGFVYDRFAIVHAGLDPQYGLQEQPKDALLMGRGRMGDLPDDVTLVHGHYIVTEPVITPRRLSIDTGAYRTGLLTAVRLSGNDAPEVVTVTAE